MAQHRYRQNKIKREHTIIEGLLPILEEIASHPKVHGITPGRINQRTSNRNTTVTFQYKTETGLKLLARSRAAIQEVFLVTDDPETVLRDLTKRRLIKSSEPKQNADDNRQQKKGDTAPKHRTKRRGDGKAKDDPKGLPEPKSESNDQDRPFDPPPSPGRRPKKPEVADAIDPEMQERLQSLARQGTGAHSPAPQKRSKKRTHVWRDVVRTHRALLSLEETLLNESQEQPDQPPRR